MNIQAADILSLFPGIDSLENLQQTLITDGALPESFADTLRAEIQQLQAVLQQEQAAADFSGHDFSIQPVDGNILPSTGKTDLIDLDQTFKTLEDIVNRLQTLGLDGHKDVQSIDDLNQFLPVAGQPLHRQETTQNTGQTNSQEESDPVALALAAIQQTLNPTSEPVAAIVTDSQAQFEQKVMAKESMPLSERWLNSQNLEKASGLKPAVMNDAQATDDKSQAGQSFYKNNPSILDAEPKNKLTEDDFAERKSAFPLDSKSTAKTTDVASGLMELNRAVSHLQPQTKMPSVAVQHPVGHPQWGDEMADKIVWMAQKQIPSAAINLNPRHLGPVSIHIDVDKDQTSIAFHATNPLVKDSIEAALPRLKEMLASQQLNLVEVNVSQQQSEQKQSSQAFFQMNKDENGKQNQPDSQPETLADSAASVIDEIESGKAIVSQGIVSLFA
jgi:flagellar hook-length control protein FliK